MTKTVGTENITINANNINEFSVKDLDVSTAMDFTKIGDKKETRTYTVTYNGVESNAIEYIVLCIHCLNEKEYLHITGEPVAATCVSRGYTVYHCNECDCNVYKNYTPIDPYAHKIAYEDSRDATCYEEGYIGRIYCERKLCGHTFEEGYTIPKKSHVFTKIDDIYHGCENEKEANGTYQHYEAHQYTITESVEHRNIDGVWQDVLIYNYVCQGCGYKKEVVDINTKLAENIIKSGGCIISEYPLGTGPNRENFPARNRIISGLCNGVLVIEAKLKSGTMITIDFALEQGRDVFAIPRNIDSINSMGANELIRQGAKLVTNYKEIIEEYIEF